MSAPVPGGASGPIVKTEPCERPLHDELITIAVDGVKMEETVLDENARAAPEDKVSRETAVPVSGAASSPVIKTEPCEDPLREDFTNIEFVAIKLESHSLYTGHEIKEEMDGSTEISIAVPGLVPKHEDWAAAELAKHRRAHHTPVSLPLHGGTTAGERELDHTTTQKRPFSCVHCGKEFITKSNLNEHLRVHTGLKSFACNKCDKSFTLMGDLVRHVRAHTDAKPFNTGAKRFDDKSNLVRNRRKELKSFVCVQCARRFSTKRRLNIHQRLHTGEKPFTCDQCDKSYARKENLNTHLRVHTGGKPFACDQCDKSFYRKHDFTEHMIVHTGQKPYTCNHCDQRFTAKSSLHRHQRLHTGEKLVTCDQCDKTFTQKCNLIKHLRIHSGEKRFACDQCNKSFTEKDTLNKHLRIHTGIKPYACDHCDKKFTFKSNRNKHLRVHTGVKLLS